MTKKQKIIIGLLLAAALLAVAVLVFMSLNPSQPNSQTERQQAVSNTAASNSIQNTPSQAAPVNNFQKANSGPAAVEAVARSFAERFGSFSNQSDFENIIDLYPFMTAKMRAWAEDYVVKTRAATQAGGVYYGITTRALGVKVLQQNTTSAVLEVNTSRRETGGNLGEVKEYLQNIELTLLKDNSDFWKVDQAQWKK